MKKLSILGAGAWGTALAMVARRAGLAVLIQARELAVVRNINYDHENKLFLSGYPLDPLIHATNDLAQARVHHGGGPDGDSRARHEPHRV